MARGFNQVQEGLTERKLVGMLLMDMMRAFRHFSRNSLLLTVQGMGTDGDLMRSTE